MQSNLLEQIELFIVYSIHYNYIMSAETVGQCENSVTLHFSEPRRCAVKRTGVMD